MNPLTNGSDPQNNSDTTSSISNFENANKLEEQPVYEAPQQYVPVNDNIHAANESGIPPISRRGSIYSTPENLDKTLEDPDNIRRLESLSRVLSNRRLSVSGADASGELVIDPDDFDLNFILNTIRQKARNEDMPAKYSGVSLTDVTVMGVDVSTSYVPSVSEVIRSIVSLPSLIKNKLNPPIRPLIRDVNGLVREGEMLLVLGKPGSGCTTLLKTIAGEVDQFKGIKGGLMYSGASLEDMQRYFRSEVIYNAERK